VACESKLNTYMQSSPVIYPGRHTHYVNVSTALPKRSKPTLDVTVMKLTFRQIRVECY